MKKDAIFIILQIFPGQSDDFRDKRIEGRTKKEKEQIKEQRVRHRLMMKMLERGFSRHYTMEIVEFLSTAKARDCLAKYLVHHDVLTGDDLDEVLCDILRLTDCKKRTENGEPMQKG